MKRKNSPANKHSGHPILQNKVLLFLLAFVLLGTGAIVGYGAIPASVWKSMDISGGYIWLPDLVANYFNGKDISLHFYLASGEVLDVCGKVYPAGATIPRFNLAAPRPSITELDWKICDKPDYDVSMSDLNAVSLATSLTPIRTFASLMDKGEIKVNPHGEENAIRFQYAYNEFRQMDGQEVPADIREIFQKYLPNSNPANSS